MRKRSIIWCFLLVGVFVAVPWTALADCAADCTKSCSGETGKAYEDCMVPCLQDCQKNDPPPVPSVPPPSLPAPVESSKDGGS